MNKIIKKKYIIRAYNADPNKKEYCKAINGNAFLLFIYKHVLNIFYDYVDVDVRYV